MLIVSWKDRGTIDFLVFIKGVREEVRRLDITVRSTTHRDEANVRAVRHATSFRRTPSRRSAHGRLGLRGGPSFGLRARSRWRRLSIDLGPCRQARPPIPSRSEAPHSKAPCVFPDTALKWKNQPRNQPLVYGVRCMFFSPDCGISVLEICNRMYSERTRAFFAANLFARIDS